MRACRPKSSLIERVAFDDAASQLEVCFPGSRRYAYFDVPRAIYDALCKAASAGQFYNREIKGHYPCREVSPRRRFRPAD